jgi:hypothetical protein
MRVNNQYCRPNGVALSEALVEQEWPEKLVSKIYYGGQHSSPAIKQFVGKLQKVKSSARVTYYAPDKKSTCRYVGLNLCPWVAGRVADRKDTTIEFRLHRESHNYERLLNWTRLCIALVDYAANHTDAEIDALPKRASRALMVVAGSTAITPAAQLTVPGVTPDAGLAGWVVSRVRAWRKDTKRRGRKVKYTEGKGWFISNAA